MAAGTMCSRSDLSSSRSPAMARHPTTVMRMSVGPPLPLPHTRPPGPALSPGTAVASGGRAAANLSRPRWTAARHMEVAVRVDFGGEEEGLSSARTQWCLRAEAEWAAAASHWNLVCQLRRSPVAAACFQSETRTTLKMSLSNSCIPCCAGGPEEQGWYCRIRTHSSRG